MSQLVENLSISMIKYIDDILLSLGKCVEMFGDSSSPSTLVDKIPCIEKAIKEIDKTVSVLPGTLQGLCSGYNEVFRTLADNRHSLIGRINERKMKEIQMNTMGDMYDSDNLIDDISIAVDDIYERPDLRYVRIDTVIDPREYSVLGIVNKFENEKMLLSDLRERAMYNLSQIREVINRLKSSILSIKSKITDGEVIDDLLNNDTKVYNDILSTITFCNTELTNTRNTLKLCFKLYRSLMNNYGIYNTAVTKYTSITLESYFNMSSSYEIC